MESFNFSFSKEDASGADSYVPSKKRGRKKAEAENDITEFVVFLKALKVMLRTGRTSINIISTLEGHSVKKLKQALGIVKDELISGKSLPSAFRNSGFFSENFCNIFEVGETSGELEKALESYVLYMTKTMGMRRLLKSAMTYPTVMLSVLGAALFGIVVYVIPSFKGIIADITVGQDYVELNLATQIFFGLHSIVEPLGKVVPILIILAFIAFMFIKGKSIMAAAFEKWIPKLRQVKSEMDWGQWLLLGSVCIDTGMQIPKMLKTLGGGSPGSRSGSDVQNLPPEFRRKDEDGGIIYDSLITRVSVGEKLSAAFRDFNVPSMIANSIAIAEESAKLGETMKDLADIYLDGADFKVKNITEIINPVITIITAIFVGLFVSGIMSIIMSVNDLASRI